MNPRLRPARPADGERLLAWRNDPTTRRFAFTPGIVDPQTHAAWFARSLDDRAREIWIAEDDAGEALGQVRLDAVSDDVAVVDISVAPSARGRGVARAMLLSAGAATQLDVRTMRALVDPGNEASLRAFVAAGFVELERTAERVVLERPIAVG